MASVQTPAWRKQSIGLPEWRYFGSVLGDSGMEFQARLWRSSEGRAVLTRCDVQVDDTLLHAHAVLGRATVGSGKGLASIADVDGATNSV